MKRSAVHPDILGPIQRLLQQHRAGDIDVKGRQDGQQQQQQQQQDLLFIDGAEDVTRQSVHYLVDFLSSGAHQATELVLSRSSLVFPCDGGLIVLCNFFANIQTATLTKVIFGRNCNVGGLEESALLLTAFHRNHSVSDLTIGGIRRLEGAVLGNCISVLLENNTTLQRHVCSWFHLSAPAIRAMRSPVLHPTEL
jgi:hypothetical protein